MDTHLVDQLVGERELLDLARALIAIESHRDAPGREEGAGRYLARWLSQRGVDAERQVVVGERANVVARLPGDDGRSLLLNGHLDTVPAGEMESAFEPRIVGDRLVGRGACDMKGAVAAMACAVVAILRSGAKLSGDVVLAATIDEETGSMGAGKLAEAGRPADYCIVGEPTALKVGIAHKGVAFVRISLHGRAAHGSRPDEGVNAAIHGARLTLELLDSLGPALEGRVHHLLGQSTLNIGRVCGGSQPNIVADRCEIDIDRRTLPNEPDPVVEIEHRVTEYCRAIDGLGCSVEELPESAGAPHVALQAPADSTLVAAVRAAAAAAGASTEVTGLTYWTDGAVFAASGAETVVVGPGDIAQAHGPDEWVRLEELRMAARIYAQTALDLLAREDPR